MARPDWKVVLQSRFDRKIQPLDKGTHAYRLLHPVTIRVDGKDIHIPAGALFTFPQDDIAQIAESNDGQVTLTIELSSISLIVFE